MLQQCSRLPRDRVLLLASMVVMRLGGSTSSVGRNCDLEVDSAKQTNRSNVIAIGQLNHGVCRHRSMLMKFVADYINREEKTETTDPTRLRVRLVRGNHGTREGPHVWNIVDLGSAGSLSCLLDCSLIAHRHQSQTPSAN
jgi:hypothetical protein